MVFDSQSRLDITLEEKLLTRLSPKEKRWAVDSVLEAGTGSLTSTPNTHTHTHTHTHRHDIDTQTHRHTDTHTRVLHSRAVLGPLGSCS